MLVSSLVNYTREISQKIQVLFFVKFGTDIQQLCQMSALPFKRSSMLAVNNVVTFILSSAILEILQVSYAKIIFSIPHSYFG